MKYYKLTLLKDVPQGKAGYSKTFDEKTLKEYCYYSSFNETDCFLIYYQNCEDFVKKEIDFSKAIKSLKCSCCNSESLFSFTDEKFKEYDGGGITYTYRPVGVECGLCGKKVMITNICIDTTIHY